LSLQRSDLPVNGAAGRPDDGLDPAGVSELNELFTAEQAAVRHAASELIAKGWRPIPVPRSEKGPVIPGWQHLTIGPGDIDAHFPADGTPSNLGVLLGDPSNGLVDVDLDAPEAAVVAKHLLPATGMVHGRPGKPSSHFWYIGIDPPPKATMPFDDIDGTRLVELRSTGGQTIVPPSIHPSREPLAWERDEDPAMVGSAELILAVKKVAAATLLARRWPDGGSRQDCAMALAGGLHRVGWGDDEIKSFITAVCEAAGDEPGDASRRLDAARYTSEKFTAGKPTTGWTRLAELLGEDGKKVVDRARGWLGAKHQTTSANEAAGALKIADLVSVQPRKIEWLWQDRLPKGCISLLEGDPGQGKSLMTVCLAAAVSTGRAVVPGDEPIGPSADVVLLSAEDDIERTILPRLKVAGADLSRVRVIRAVGNGADERPVELPRDLPLLEEVVMQNRAALLIFDPWSAYLNGKVDAHKDADVRKVLHALKQLAERTGVAVLIVRHLNKAQDVAAMYRGGGSIGIIAAARTAFVVGRHPEDDGVSVLALQKTNLGQRVPSLAYRVVERECEVFDAAGKAHIEKFGCIEWLGEEDLAPDDLLARPRPGAGQQQLKKREAAIDFLKEALANGPVPSKKLEEDARARGIKSRTLDRAIAELRVEPYQAGGVWHKKLPDRPAQVAEAA
jgi:hypothetical protein